MCGCPNFGQGLLSNQPRLVTKTIAFFIKLIDLVTISLSNCLLHVFSSSSLNTQKCIVMHAYHVEKRSCMRTCLDCCSKVAVTQNKKPKPPADFSAMSAVPKSVSDAFKRFDADGTLGYHLYSYCRDAVSKHRGSCMRFEL